MSNLESAEVIVIPMYCRSDFEKFRRMYSGQNLPSSYDTWLARAESEMRSLLAKGCIFKIVVLHLDDYLAWLEINALEDSDAVRSRYLFEVSKGKAHKADGGVRTDAAWPELPNTLIVPDIINERPAIL